MLRLSEFHCLPMKVRGREGWRGRGNRRDLAGPSAFVLRPAVASTQQSYLGIFDITTPASFATGHRVELASTIATS